MLAVLRGPRLHQLFESWLERHNAGSLLKVKEFAEGKGKGSQCLFRGRRSTRGACRMEKKAHW